MKSFIYGVSSVVLKSNVVELLQKVVELLQFFRFIVKSFF